MQTYKFLIVLVCFTNQLNANRLRDKSLPLTKDNVNHLFDRIHEPIFLPKDNILFKLPTEYLLPEYQSMATEISNRFSNRDDIENILVKTVSTPNLTIPLQLGHDESFTPFLPFHRKMAKHLIEILMKAETLEDFLSISIYCRDRINPQLFVYALSVAMLHRPDTSSLLPPSLLSVFPEKFFDGTVLSSVRTEDNIVPSGLRVPIEIPRNFTASDKDFEHRLAYFREDIGYNLNHWHWHLVYPTDGPLEIVNKDRRGELFYYFHHQIMARYNFERFSNKLPRAIRFINWFEPIAEPYFPKLTNLLSSRVWAPRLAYTRLRDINRQKEQIQFYIVDLVRWRERIYDAIHLGKAINENGEIVDLTGPNGIDILGNIVESSILSINRNFYGDMHNLGHVAIAFSHDPDGRHLEAGGVMGDTTTAVRDPIFYRWHGFVDDLFQEYKNTLPRYTEEELTFKGIVITGLEVVSNGEKNEFVTFWRKHDIDLSHGLDFAPRGPVYVRLTVLHHADFVYRIQVENNGAARVGMVRIFLAPKFDEIGNPLLLKDQKVLFIELDKFIVDFKPGVNAFQRSSIDSSVTVPFEVTYRGLNNPLNNNTAEFNYCVCGWPDNLLIPKGWKEGLPAQLFVMISDYEKDKVEQTPPEGCRQAHSYCGWLGRLYPDKQNMGFPFDRLPREGVNTLCEFLTPNMRVLDVKIRHIPKLED